MSLTSILVAVAVLMPLTVQENKDKAARANPISYIMKDAPPFLS